MSEIIKWGRQSNVRVLRMKPIVTTSMPEAAEWKENSLPCPSAERSPSSEFVKHDEGNKTGRDLEAEYQRGILDGRQEAELALRNETELKLSGDAMRVDEFINKASEQFSILYGSSEQAVLKFAIGVSERIMRREVSLDRSLILNQIREGVLRILGVERVKIRVHPSELQFVREHRSEIQSSSDAIRDIVVEADDQLTPGDCILESDMGNVDARIATQLKQIENALFESKVIA